MCHISRRASSINLPELGIIALDLHGLFCSRWGIVLALWDVNLHYVTSLTHDDKYNPHLAYHF
jgi:hypothetical protein